MRVGLVKVGSREAGVCSVGMATVLLGEDEVFSSA